MITLFESQYPGPLADRLRPGFLNEVVGQSYLLGPTAPIGRMIEGVGISSILFWDRPGTGKTTIARLLSKHTNFYFESLSAIFSGISDLRKIFNANTKLMKDIGYGMDYEYDHDSDKGFSGQSYFPDGLINKLYTSQTVRVLREKL